MSLTPGQGGISDSRLADRLCRTPPIHAFLSFFVTIPAPPQATSTPAGKLQQLLPSSSLHLHLLHATPNLTSDVCCPGKKAPSLCCAWRLLPPAPTHLAASSLPTRLSSPQVYTMPALFSANEPLPHPRVLYLFFSLPAVLSPFHPLRFKPQLADPPLSPTARSPQMCAYPPVLFLHATQHLHIISAQQIVQ